MAACMCARRVADRWTRCDSGWGAPAEGMDGELTHTRRARAEELSNERRVLTRELLGRQLDERLQPKRADACNGTAVWLSAAARMRRREHALRDLARDWHRVAR